MVRLPFIKWLNSVKVISVEQRIRRCIPMRYALAVVFSFIAVTIAPAWAQQGQDRGRASRIELYGGYDYIRFNINASASVLQPPSET